MQGGCRRLRTQGWSVSIRNERRETMKSFDIKTKIYFGDQALDRLAEIPYQRVLVITDPFMAQSSMINLVTDPLKRAARNLRFSRMWFRIRPSKRFPKA